MLYKIVNLVCRADITRVLVLDVYEASSVPHNIELQCQWIDPDGIDSLLHDDDFQIRQEFVDDFKQLGFRGVTATVDGSVAGVLFLVPESIAARHNSGGLPFKGVGLDLPAGVLYLFKVAVKSKYRGLRINAQMLSFAVEQLRSVELDTIVTTTDWTNHSYLKSVENYGFKRCGFACEWVVAGRHFYQMPEIVVQSGRSSHRRESRSSPAVFHYAESRVIKFTSN